MKNKENLQNILRKTKRVIDTATYAGVGGGFGMSGGYAIARGLNRKKDIETQRRRARIGGKIGALLGAVAGVATNQFMSAKHASLEIAEDKSSIKRPLSALGRFNPLNLLKAGLLGTTAPLKRAPKKKDLEYLKKYYKSKENLKVYPGYTPAFDKLDRVWESKRLNTLEKVIGNIATPGIALRTGLSRADHYDSFAHTISAYTNEPAIAFHELGHAKDYTKGSPLARKLGRAHTLGLQDEYIASNNAMKDVKKYYKNDKKNIRRSSKILGGAYGSYVGGAINKITRTTNPKKALRNYLLSVTAGQLIGKYGKPFGH